MQQRTVFFITHRIITSLEFTQILVMEDGKITQQGTHTQLMKQTGYYAELYHRQQMSKEGSSKA
jgi:ABC-type multidrug transport system fused ATPase/permease subunit